MRARLVASIVHDQALYSPAGDVTRWVHRVNRALGNNVRREAPRGRDSGRVNKTSHWAGYPEGSLKRSISNRVDHVSLRLYVTNLSVNVPYAMYVIKGTGPIRARMARIPAGTYSASGQPLGGRFAPGARGMVLPPNVVNGRSYRGGIRVQQVSGQAPNNFIRRGWNITALAHPALRSISLSD